MADEPINLENEVWRVIPSVQGVIVSSAGRVFKLPHIGEMPGGGAKHYATKPNFGVTKTAKIGARHSYKAVWYRELGNLKIHRLVCEAFHGPPPFDGAVVMHLNEDSHDNRSENLAWGSQRENLNAIGFIEYCSSRTGPNHPRNNMNKVKGRV